MSRSKINSTTRNLVLRENNKAPYLGVRGLAVILATKYKLTLSKSSIHNILKNKGVKSDLGRKPAKLAHALRMVEPCGLMVLRALDSEIGLFDYLSDELKKYFSDLDRSQLKQLIVLSSFSFLVDKNIRASLRKSGFLRVVGLRQLPAKIVDQFNQTITNKHPIVSLSKLKKELRPVSAVKFYFKDGSQGFSDGRLATFWDRPSNSEDFSLPLRVVHQRLQKMFEQKVLIIGYTRSFNYLSQAAANFSKGIKSGLAKVELIDLKGEVCDQLKPLDSELSLVFGYSPQILVPVDFPRVRLKKFKRFLDQELGEFYLLNTPTTFTFPKQNQELRLDNIQIKKGNSSVSWGFLAFLPKISKRSNLAGILTQYLYLWPYVVDEFFREVEAAEGRGRLSLTGGSPMKILPEKLIFTQPIDFVRVGQILSALFKELIGGWEPRLKSGTLSLRKGYIKIVLKQVPVKIKKAFNRSCLYIDNRRAFLD
ncbi:MAG: hypothetical protein K9L86_00140 [Candidatus Omnitrophica bacterium]|nr:hypothetical protein [Candidatus Omnitrophota bacterium]